MKEGDTWLPGIAVKVLIKDEHGMTQASWINVCKNPTKFAFLLNPKESEEYINSFPYRNPAPLHLVPIQKRKRVDDPREEERKQNSGETGKLGSNSKQRCRHC